jgi:hypothetical protein
MLEVRWAEVELPELIAPPRLEAHSRRRSRHPHMIIAPLSQIAVGGLSRQRARWQFDQPIRHLHAVPLHQFDGAAGRKVAPLLVGGTQLERGDHLTPPLQFGRRDFARLATIRPPHRSWPVQSPKLPVQRDSRNAVHSGGVFHHAGAVGMPTWQRVHPPAQGDERLRWNGTATASGHHSASDR